MILKIDVPDCDVMSVDEVMDKIAESQGWKVKKLCPNSAGTFEVVVADGRKAEYDVLGDELLFDDDEVGNLFNDFDAENKWYTGESLSELLDATDIIWGEDEEGNYKLYVEP